MLAELKFIQGAVAKKEIIETLAHIIIKDGFVRSFDGSLALCSPIALDIECQPKAAPLIEAIAKCTDTIALSLTEAGRLRVQSGKFRAFIDCLQEEVPSVEPNGECVAVDGEVLVNAMKLLLPFIAADASRPWSNGILFRDQSALATNNVVLVEYWLGTQMPVKINVPVTAAKEVIRIGEAPTHLQVTDNSITFHYEGGRWLRSQLLSSAWPDVSAILEKETAPVPINEELFSALNYVKKFVDDFGRVHVRDNTVSTHREEGMGAQYNVELPECDAVFQHKMLSLLENVATHIDLSTYPAPCIFYGDRLRGAIIGMRL